AYAYPVSQSSARMVLVAAGPGVRHARSVGDAAPAATGEAVGDALGVAPPPHAVARIARDATRTARVLVMFPTFPVSPDLWTPRLEPVLDAVEDGREQHARAGDQDHAGKGLRGLEGLARDGDDLADAV